MASSKRILIIDDDNRNIFALTAVLKAKGYQCMSALFAEDGLKLISEHPEIAVVLMDMMMPGMDGYEAIAKMKATPELSSIPVIAVTAQAMVGDKERCINAGAVGYISKPVNVDNLVKLISQYI